MAEDPSTSENPLEEEKDLLRRKMSVSKRVFKLAEHFESTILNPTKEDEDVRPVPGPHAVRGGPSRSRGG